MATGWRISFSEMCKVSTKAEEALARNIKRAFPYTATDSIKVRPNFSVSLGLRWEPFFARTSSEEARKGALASRTAKHEIFQCAFGERFIPAMRQVFPLEPFPIDTTSSLPELVSAWQPKFVLSHLRARRIWHVCCSHQRHTRSRSRRPALHSERLDSPTPNNCCGYDLPYQSVGQFRSHQLH